MTRVESLVVALQAEGIEPVSWSEPTDRWDGSVDIGYGFHIQIFMPPHTFHGMGYEVVEEEGLMFTFHGDVNSEVEVIESLKTVMTTETM